MLYHDEEFKNIFLQAGATRLINISEVGGRLLANHVFEPNAADVAIDLISHGGLDIIEVSIPKKYSEYTISDLRKIGVKSIIIK